ncbi:MAG: hypothetical protein DDT34_01702 [Firmicutes bacterium]|nr:hypothetical protein [Bacillota bacterium]
MLTELARYAENQGLASKPGYKPKDAKWTIVITDEGDFVHLLKETRTHQACPHLEQAQLIAGKETRSHFLLDSLQVIACIHGDKGSERDKEKVLNKHRYFAGMLESASKCEPLLRTCRTFLRSAAQLQLLQQAIVNHKAKLTDAATIRVGNVYVVDITTWHTWWDSHVSALPSGKASGHQEMRCFMTGGLVEPASSHPKISGLTSVGGQSSGTALISFDKESFTSYGLAQSRNAACSTEAGVVYRDALNHLIVRARKPIAGSLYLHWYHQTVSEEDDLLDFAAFDSSEADESSARIKARRLLQSIRTGERPDLMNNMYYVLQTSGVGGRIMIRDWYCDNFAVLVTSVNAWFDDLALVGPQGVGCAEGGKIAAYLMRLVSYRGSEDIRDTFARIDKELTSTTRHLWRSILQQRPLPHDVASRALLHIRGRLLQGGDESNLDRIACSLLKAWVCREDKRKGDRTHMKQDLNLEHPSPAYHAGRMMAVLAALQQSALGDVGAGVIQRYYASASTTPALVLGRLIKSAQFHLSKLDRGLAHWYEMRLASVSTGIGTSLPTTLTLEEQALFALGYYQQKAALYAVRSGKTSERMEVDINAN